MSDVKPDRTIEQAKFAATQARRQLASTLAALQGALKPGALANRAWTGVRDKGEDLAEDAVQVVKDRPLTAGGIAAAVAIVAARRPLWRAANRLFDRDPDDEGVITADLDDKDRKLDLSAPVLDSDKTEGATQ